MPKTLSFSAKCSDLFGATLHDGSRSADYQGYVPRFLGGGDYVALKIDLATGQILNWKPPSEEELAELFAADPDPE